MATRKKHNDNWGDIVHAYYVHRRTHCVRSVHLVCLVLYMHVKDIPTDHQKKQNENFKSRWWPMVCACYVHGNTHFVQSMHMACLANVCSCREHAKWPSGTNRMIIGGQVGKLWSVHTVHGSTYCVHALCMEKHIVCTALIWCIWGMYVYIEDIPSDHLEKNRMIIEGLV